jgi:DNA primase
MQPLAQLPSVRYPYCDRDGTLLFTLLRHYPKRFELVDAQDRLLPDGAFPRYVLYRLPELLAADPGETVWYVEGEKDVESLRQAGLIATTNPGGSRYGWKDQYADDLRGRHVIIVPDADGPGQRLAAAVAAGLRAAAASVVTLHLPIHGRDDVSDWLARRGSIARLRELAVRTRSGCWFGMSWPC